MSEELKPCPFCGREAELRTDGDDSNYPIWIQCTKCQAGIEPFPDKEFAILEWNTRHIPDGYKLVNKQVNMESKLADTLADIMDYPTYTDATNIQRVWSDLLEATE